MEHRRVRVNVFNVANDNAGIRRDGREPVVEMLPLSTAAPLWTLLSILLWATAAQLTFCHHAMDLLGSAAAILHAAMS